MHLGNPLFQGTSGPSQGSVHSVHLVPSLFLRFATLRYYLSLSRGILRLYKDFRLLTKGRDRISGATVSLS